VVADVAAHDILIKELSFFSADKGFEVKVLDDDGACIFLKDRALEDRRVMVVLSSIAGAEKLYTSGLHFAGLNIGNIHHADFKTKLSPSAMITEDEEAALQRLRADGVTIDVRALPDAGA